MRTIDRLSTFVLCVRMIILMRQILDKFWSVEKIDMIIQKCEKVQVLHVYRN